jgi:Domain of unknown function (DUF222)
MPTDVPTLLATPPPTAELERLGDEIAELSAHLDAATARLLDLIREFDACGGWNTGFRSCADWLAWRVGLDLGAARERVRVARALGTLPQLAEALARGELSFAKVRALTRVATPECEARLLAVGRAGTAAHVERIVRGWRRVDRQAEAREAGTRHHLLGDDQVPGRRRLVGALAGVGWRRSSVVPPNLWKRDANRSSCCPEGLVCRLRGGHGLNAGRNPGEDRSQQRGVGPSLVQFGARRVRHLGDLVRVHHGGLGNLRERSFYVG